MKNKYECFKKQLYTLLQDRNYDFMITLYICGSIHFLSAANLQT